MTDAQNTLPDSPAADQPGDQQLKAKRRKALGLIGIILVLALALYLIWKVFFNSSVSTDNAYVGAETASVTSMVTGQVAQVLVSDTRQVKKGDVLVQIDPRDAEIALAQAKAELMKAQRQYRQTQANSSALNSQVFVSDDGIHSAEAQVAKAKAELDKAKDEFSRRRQLSASGAISKEELSSAQSALNNAQAGYDLAQAGLAQAKSSQKAAQSTLAANEALIRGSNENSAPDVLIAQARLKQALLDLERTEIKAPFDGVVTRRNIQAGQQIGRAHV